ncbi:MAG: trypsin-like peptidase domain-containing protein [Cryobacterium sp.]|nr:trypsin-like peptidase domain-containing protein [Oligoflexia bacterium]
MKSLFITSLVLLSLGAHANESAIEFPTQSENYNFEGIVALDNCSGAIFRTSASRATDPALVMTNGHCLEFGMPNPGVVVTDKPSTRRFGVEDPKTSEILGSVHARKVMYSTMTTTDLTVYVLEESYADIFAKFKVRPFMLANRYPKIGEPINIISGYHHNGYTCKVDAIIPTLLEAEWTMHESIRFTPECKPIHGTSGSPIISRETGEIIGINNTGNDDGEMCTMDNPCEVSADGKKTVHQGIGYGEQTNWLFPCMATATDVDLNRKDCRLPRDSKSVRNYSGRTFSSKHKNADVPRYRF